MKGERERESGRHFDEDKLLWTRLVSSACPITRFHFSFRDPLMDPYSPIFSPPFLFQNRPVCLSLLFVTRGGERMEKRRK